VQYIKSRKDMTVESQFSKRRNSTYFYDDEMVWLITGFIVP